MLAPRFQAAALTDAVHSLARAVADLPPDPRFSQRPRAFLVGGCVRDALLGQPSKDADMEIYGVAPDTLERLAHTLFADVDAVGQSFAVLKAFVEGGDLDLAIPRRERKAGRGHTGFFIESDPDLSFEEACRRRDFTVNALLLDPLTGALIDPFHGQEDLSRKQLRVVDTSFFSDDPLRVYRAVQFASRFGFFIEPTSLALLVSMVERGDLAELSAERVTDELRKLLLQSEAPSIGCALLRELGIVARTYPELEALAHTPQEPEWHPEGDVWTHTLLALDHAATLIRREPFNEAQALGVMLGTLCHDLGKPATTAMGEKDGMLRLRSLGHEEAGVAPTRSLLARWTFGDEALTAAIACAKEHHALLRPLPPQQPRREHHDDRGSGRIRPLDVGAHHQPDPAQRQEGRHLRRGPAAHSPPGSQRDHGG
jgi:tRNA nucleotidyltransferase (CCA-adding enzyme)